MVGSGNGGAETKTGADARNLPMVKIHRCEAPGRWGRGGEKSKIANAKRDSESPAPSVSWPGLSCGASSGQGMQKNRPTLTRGSRQWLKFTAAGVHGDGGGIDTKAKLQMQNATLNPPLPRHPGLVWFDGWAADKWRREKDWR